MVFAPQFKRPLVVSFGLHLICLIFILFVPKLPSFKPTVKVVWVNLPKGVSEEIDLKIKEAPALPQTTIKEQKDWLKEKPKKEETKKAVRPIQKEKSKPKKLSAIDKAMAALNKKRLSSPEAAQVKEKGEGFKYGTGTEPLHVMPNDPEKIAYVAKIRHKIIDEWIIPSAYLQGDISSKPSLVVQINERGEVITIEWATKSGNAAIDSSLLRAVERASPLPIPTERLKWEAYNEGFLVEFDPSLKGQ